MERQAQIQRLLADRCAGIVDRWYHAIIHCTTPSLSTAQLRGQLTDLAERAIAVLHTEPFAEDQAQLIGTMLAQIHPPNPEILRETLTVLGTGLGVDLPASASAAWQHRLMALLGTVAMSYCDRMRGAILTGQEEIHEALLFERERIAAALRESETRSRAIFYGAVIGIALVGLDGRPVACNPALERMLGYHVSELRGMVFTEIAHPNDVATDRELYRELVLGERDFYRTEKRYLNKDGHVVWCNLTASLVRDPDGRPQFTIGMVEDITERKRIAADLIEAQRRLAESQEAERLRLARDLHDSAVQQLLDINRHLTEAHRRAGTQQRVEVFVSDVEAIQCKVQDVTAQLRDLIRDLRPPGLEEFGLLAALDGYVAGLRREAHQAMPEIALDMAGQDSDLPLSISLTLIRAAQEALRNTLDHAHARHVTLSVHVLPGKIVLSVHDDGVGFDVPSPLRRLIHDDHFGLIGIAERVALAEGEFAVRSRPGKGTTVAVMLPRST